jgi:hypothetical protein
VKLEGLADFGKGKRVAAQKKEASINSMDASFE